jgi:NAD(P)-dependent dehydrogenase (short-subunit alcohol dehydrogenase family)
MQNDPHGNSYEETSARWKGQNGKSKMGRTKWKGEDARMGNLPLEPATLQDKTVLITGGTRGLGKTMAEMMVERGATVIVTSRNLPRESYPDLVPRTINRWPLDVTDEASVVRLFHALDTQCKRLGRRLDVLVNNAGIGVFKPVLETTLAEWNAIIATNLTGVFLCSREAFRLMKDTGGGRIITISSISGYQPIVENGAYGASKFGVSGFSQILNEEGKPFNIRVSVVYPGAVYTDIWEGREGFRREDMMEAVDVAETVCDIASRPLRVRIDEVKIVPPKGVL